MMAQFDHGYDPMSTMTLLHAIRWAISAWDIDLSMDTICNCFAKALSLRESTTIPSHDQGLIRDIEHGLHELEQANNIQQAMDISQFLNPADEQVHDSLMSIDDAIIGQFPAGDDKREENDDNRPILLQILASEVLKALYKVQLHEEQQEDANQDLIQLLCHHERVLFRRKQARQQQIDIHNYFS